MASSADSELADCLNSFSLDVYKHIAVGKPAENAFLSPSSILVVMAMVHMGANGNTLDQMTNTLKLDKLQKKKAHEVMGEFIRILKKDNTNFTLTMANRIFPHADKTILDKYVKTVSEHFMADTKMLDYTINPEGSRLEINKWVEMETNNKIKDLLAPGIITPLTAMVIVNAIYFKGDWATKFDAENTMKNNFFISESNSVQVDMMRRTFNKVKYGESERLACQVLGLPYKGEELSMVVVLPKQKDGLPALEKQLTLGELTKLSSELHPTKVEVALPKFKLESSYTLNDMLCSLGMPDLFDETKADLSGMSKEQLFVSHVIHKAFVDVNEEGTEAAAATGAVIMKRSIQIVQRFVADHPFLFMIWDNRMGVPLFMGRFVSPTEIAQQKDEL